MKTSTPKKDQVQENLSLLGFSISVKQRKGVMNGHFLKRDDVSFYSYEELKQQQLTN